MKKILVLIFCVLAILGCKNKAEETVLQLGVMPSMDYLPLAVAEREGYFEKQGVNVKLVKFYSANERDASFQANVIDGTVIDYTGAILQKAGGINLKLISQCDAPFYIIAGKNTGIISVSELKGKKVAVSQNTVIDFIMDMALNKASLTDSDVEKVEINKIPLRFEMLNNGKIDATGLPDPLALIAEKAGNTVLTDNIELGFAITGIMFTEKAVVEKSAEIKKMYAAYNMGVEYMRTHPVEDIADVLGSMGFTPEIISSANIMLYKDAVSPAMEDLELTTKWLAGRGLIDSGFDLSSLYAANIIN